MISEAEFNSDKYESVDKKKSTATNDCSLGNPVPCIAAMVYYVGPGLASNVAYIGAYFFSIVVQLSLQSTAYALDFISNGWTTVRDIANMAFIFILIYIALTVMLFAETSGTIKQLALVVVIALLVNFSFFFTRLIIDTGNILAIQFYNAIPSDQYIDSKGVTTSANINGVKDLSFSIMGAVQLQKLYGSDAFTKASNACGKDSNGQWCGLIVSTVVYVAVAAMFWMLFFAFLQVGIKFLLRIVGLWFLIIASPLAFVAKTIPKTAGYFDQWFKKLIEFSIYPAIFLFMFLILTGFTKQLMSADGKGGGTILDAAMNSGGGSATGIGAAIATVGIRMGFVLALMYVALHVSEWMVKEGSSMASKITSKSLGGFTRFGAASIGFAGRQTIGRGANLLGQSATFNKLVDRADRTGVNKKLWGRIASGTKSLEKATYDVRNAPGGGLLKQGVDKIVGAPVEAGKGATQGIAEQIKTQKEKSDKERKDRAAIVRDAANKDAIKRIADDLKKGNPHSQEDTDRVKNFTKREMGALKTADVETIAHLITESQLKGEMENDNRTDTEKEGIRNIAEPIIKSQKIVADELRKASSALRLSAVNVVQQHTTKGAEIDAVAIADMHLDVNNQKQATRTYIMNNPGENHAERNVDLTQLQNMTNSLNELSKQVGKIKAVGTRPEHVHKVA